MPDAPSKLKKGLGPEDALRRWSDKTDFDKLVELSGQPNPPPVEDARQLLARNEAKLEEYIGRREAIEDIFREKLIDGEVLGSGIRKYTSRRELIDRTLWEALTIDYGFADDAVGLGSHYQKIEFFDPKEIPDNVPIEDVIKQSRSAPTNNQDAFDHDAGYRHVSIRRNFSFSFGPIQARVVGLLHAAALNGDGWRSGKEILEEAGSRQLKMGDVFKSQEFWTVLIESDGKGMYRLRIPMK